MTHREDDELHEANEPVPVSGRPIRPSVVAQGPQSPAAPRELADVLNEAFELMRALGGRRETDLNAVA